MTTPDPARPVAAPPRTTLATLLVFAGASWVRLALTFSIGFVLTPMLLGAFGSSLFGIFSLFSLTIATADPITGLIQKACVRELTGAHTSRDPDRMRRIFTNAVALSGLAAIATCILPAVLAAFAPLLFNFEPQQLGYARAAIAAEGALIVSAVLFAPWTNLYLASHRIVAENAARTMARLIDLAAAVIAINLAHADRFYAFLAIRVALHFALILARCFAIRRLEPSARFSRRTLHAPTIRDMARVGGWGTADFINRFGVYDCDHIVLNWFFGPIYNAIYAVINQIRGWTRLVGVTMYFGMDVIGADLHERGRADSLRRVLVSTTAHSFAMLGFCCVIAGLFFAPLLDCWLGARLRADSDLAATMSYEQARDFSRTFLLIALPGLAFGEAHTAAASVLYGMGLIRRYAPILIVGALTRLAVVLLVLAAGASALSLAWSTTVTLLIIYAAYFPWLISRVAQTPLGAYWWRAYARPLLSLIPVFLAGLWLTSAIHSWSLVRIALCAVALAALYAPCAFFIVLDASERGRARGVLAHLLARIGVGRSRAAHAPLPQQAPASAQVALETLERADS